MVAAGTRMWPRPLRLPAPSPPRACALLLRLAQVLWSPSSPEPGGKLGLGVSPEPGFGLARHALRAAPSRAGSSGPGRGPEFVGAAPPSSSAWLARGDEEAFGAVSHRGQ